MAIAEEQRHELYQGLVDVLGRERAATLMERLPPVGWVEVATKRDLDHQRELSRRDLEREAGLLRTEMHAGFAEMAAEFSNVRAEMRWEFANVRAEMAAESTALRAEKAEGLADVRREIVAVEARFERALREQGRTFFLGMLTANTTLAGLAFAAAQLA